MDNESLKQLAERFVENAESLKFDLEQIPGVRVGVKLTLEVPGYDPIVLIDKSINDGDSPESKR